MRIWLKEIRESKSISQKNLAIIVGISNQFYNFIENGKRCPSPKKAKAMAVKNASHPAQAMRSMLGWGNKRGFVGLANNTTQAVGAANKLAMAGAGMIRTETGIGNNIERNVEVATSSQTVVQPSDSVPEVAAVHNTGQAYTGKTEPLQPREMPANGKHQGSQKEKVKPGGSRVQQRRETFQNPSAPGSLSLPDIDNTRSYVSTGSRSAPPRENILDANVTPAKASTVNEVVHTDNVVELRPQKTAATAPESTGHGNILDKQTKAPDKPTKAPDKPKKTPTATARQPQVRSQLPPRTELPPEPPEHRSFSSSKPAMQRPDTVEVPTVETSKPPKAQKKAHTAPTPSNTKLPPPTVELATENATRETHQKLEN